MLALGHALAQGLGGRYGVAHGAMNALTLPPALRFNEPVAGEAIARFGAALGSDDPPARVEELARLGGFERLRDFGVPEDAPAEVAERRRGASGREGESAPGHSSRRRAAPAFDLVEPRLTNPHGVRRLAIPPPFTTAESTAHTRCAWGRPVV